MDFGPKSVLCIEEILWVLGKPRKWLTDYYQVLNRCGD